MRLQERIGTSDQCSNMRFVATLQPWRPYRMTGIRKDRHFEAFVLAAVKGIRVGSERQI